MYDFLKVNKKWDSKAQRYIYYPSFEVKSTIKDLMVRGGYFYAIYNEETGLWETEDPKAIELIDDQVREYVQKHEPEDTLNDPEHGPIVKRIADTSNGLIQNWHRFCQKDFQGTWKPLNQKLIFSNMEPKRSDYASLKLDYPLQEEPTPYYDKLCSVLYLPDEEEKWEWFLGCIIAGEQKKIQKMLVFYGEPGSGKSTIFSVIIAKILLEKDRTSYVTQFEANNLTGRDSFGTDFLEKDAVLAYDDEAELGIITSKSALNKIISHESIRVNAKFKQPFITNPNCLLIVGSNEPVQVSPNSGMKRRLIDIRPTGNTLPADEYDDCIQHIEFEKSGIMWKCYQVYKKLGKHYYDHYVAEDMMSRTSPFQNFVVENYLELKNGISLARAYKMYTQYAEECNFKNVLPRYKFRDTLKLYFTSYENFSFSGFKKEKIGLKDEEPKEKPEEKKDISWLHFNSTKSLFDIRFANQPAQYANESGTPAKKWENVTTKLKDLDTTKLHFVQVPVEETKLVTMDFDEKDENGEKSFKKNYEAASKFPPTYAELSKSEVGIHLEYIWKGGDPKELSNIFGPNVEIKVYTGNGSLRRKLTKCNDIPIAELSSGLPLKEKGGKDKMVDWDGFKNEKVIRKMILKNLKKEYHPDTTESINYIYEILRQAYQSGSSYDVRDLKEDVEQFAENSTHNSEYCTELVRGMFFCSKDILKKENDGENEANNIMTREDDGLEKDKKNDTVIKDPNFDVDIYMGASKKVREITEPGLSRYAKKIEKIEPPLIFLDTEIAPSYKQAKEAGVELPDDIPEDTPAAFLVNWKYAGKNNQVVRMINPTPQQVEELFKYRIVTFNGRNYDTHMLYARSMGYKIEELYNLSNLIINGNAEQSRRAKFGEAYNLEYTDVYDYATKKQSLKKWEIELGIKHVEWNRPWNWPVPVKDLTRFAEYCDNDVLSLEEVWNATQADFKAREILATLAGGCVNDTTNQLSTKWVFGDHEPQLVYTDFTTGKQYAYDVPFTEPVLTMEEYEALGTEWLDKDGNYIIDKENPNHFVSYHLVRDDKGKLHNMYRGIDLKFGGYVYSAPGMYVGRLVTEDAVSLHPTDLIELNYLGPDTPKYAGLRQARVYIKHGEFDKVKQMFDGVLTPYLNNKSDAKALSKALKLALNSAYGLSSASFKNKWRDPRNINNIVALRGALIMKTLQDEVEKRGFKVVHIKTDSIKIADPTEDILKFVVDFGKFYGVEYEIEHTWKKLCLIDNAQFIGYHDDDDPESPNVWDATGKAFQVPYIYKSLFTHETIGFEDMCTTFNVTKGSLHLIFNEGQENEVDHFVGRIGQFVPVKNGGKLYRVNDGKRYAASGTTGYEWMEADDFENHHDLSEIDISYFRKECDDAIETINQFGDFENFVSSEPVENFMNKPTAPNGVEEVEFA